MEAEVFLVAVEITDNFTIDSTDGGDGLSPQKPKFRIIVHFYTFRFYWPTNDDCQRRSAEIHTKVALL